mmetsp:Transcript_8133/g.20056  ORF Transcript_8133/g.20056 Transcript_8133/m.20056 type:complete len:218 (+) Transcript_8133:414-1067(+)
MRPRRFWPLRSCMAVSSRLRPPRWNSAKFSEACTNCSRSSRKSFVWRISRHTTYLVGSSRYAGNPNRNSSIDNVPDPLSSKTSKKSSISSRLQTSISLRRNEGLSLYTCKNSSRVTSPDSSPSMMVMSSSIRARSRRIRFSCHRLWNCLSCFVASKDFSTMIAVTRFITASDDATITRPKYRISTGCEVTRGHTKTAQLSLSVSCTSEIIVSFRSPK